MSASVVFDRGFKPGILWDFLRAITDVNKRLPATPTAFGGDAVAIEPVLLFHGDTKAAFKAFRAIDKAGFFMPARQVNTETTFDVEHLKSMGFDLFLTANPNEAQIATDHGVAAATVEAPKGIKTYQRQDYPAVRLCLDGDAVTFGSSAEAVFHEQGFAAYRSHELKKAKRAVEAGPFTQLLQKITKLNAQFNKEAAPFKLSFLTARGSDSAARALTTLKDHGIEFNDRLYFMDGASKADVLKIHKPDLFFDDSMAHVEPSRIHCPCGHVPYAKDSPMHAVKAKQAAAQPK